MSGTRRGRIIMRTTTALHKENVSSDGKRKAGECVVSRKKGRCVPGRQWARTEELDL